MFDSNSWDFFTPLTAKYPSETQELLVCNQLMHLIVVGQCCWSRVINQKEFYCKPVTLLLNITHKTGTDVYWKKAVTFFGKPAGDKRCIIRTLWEHFPMNEAEVLEYEIFHHINSPLPCLTDTVLRNKNHSLVVIFWLELIQFHFHAPSKRYKYWERGCAEFYKMHILLNQRCAECLVYSPYLIYDREDFNSHLLVLPILHT